MGTHVLLCARLDTRTPPDSRLRRKLGATLGAKGPQALRPRYL